MTEPGGGTDPGAILKKVCASVKVAAHSVCRASGHHGSDDINIATDRSIVNIRSGVSKLVDQLHQVGRPLQDVLHVASVVNRLFL